ncbi:Gfo/Idh/MocA family oxidoreductase [Candidatus Dependentiae bacterium]|nr:Gfo/Idh/MocA family oxidoreductase [Candidatus Dependentiae bacterium]
MKKKITLALIGYGYWGPNIARILSRLKKVKFKYICDIDKKKLNLSSQIYPDVMLSENIEKILADSDVDAVSIATPDETHYNIAKKILLSGKHCIVEKPFVLNKSHADELFDISENVKRILFIGHTYLFSKGITTLKKIMETENVGKIKYAVSQRNNFGILRTNINALWDLLPHDLSIFIYLLNDYPEYVSCTGKSYIKSKLEDVIFCTLFFKNDIMINITANRIYPEKVRNIVVAGENKMLKYDDISGQDNVVVFDKNIKYSDKTGITEYFNSGRKNIRFKIVEPLKVEYENFIRCILNDNYNSNKIYTDRTFNVSIIKILEKIQLSLLKNGKKIKI